MSGPISLGIRWDPNFKPRTEAGFQRLQRRKRTASSSGW